MMNSCRNAKENKQKSTAAKPTETTTSSFQRAQHSVPISLSHSSHRHHHQLHHSTVGELRSWMLQYRITHCAVSALLKWLRTYDVPGMRLSVDSRTFLETPRTVDIRDMGDSYFWYNGLGKSK